MIRMVVSDLDGTLLRNDRTLSKTNRHTLDELNKLNIVRVVATGRSLYSAQKVMDDDFPIDYLIFSTGAGIIDWRTKKLLFKKNLGRGIVSETVRSLLHHKISFMLHREIPNNHHFYYYLGDNYNDDFRERMNIYKDFAQPFNEAVHNEISGTQIICILSSVKDYSIVRNLMNCYNDNLSFIKTTSPLDGKSIWLEMFAKGINKSRAASFLSKTIGIDRRDVLVVGNDWNDEDLLQWGGYSYLVSNAPKELKKDYNQVTNNQANGFTVAVENTCAINKK